MFNLSMFENAHAGQAVWAWLKITTCSGHKKGQTSFRTHNSCLSTINQQIDGRVQLGDQQEADKHLFIILLIYEKLSKSRRNQRENLSKRSRVWSGLLFCHYCRKLSFLLHRFSTAVALWCHDNNMINNSSSVLSAAGRIKHNQVVSVMWY